MTNNTIMKMNIYDILNFGLGLWNIIFWVEENQEGLMLNVLLKKNIHLKRKKKITQQAYPFCCISVPSSHTLTLLSSPRLSYCFHVLTSILSF